VLARSTNLSSRRRDTTGGMVIEVSPLLLILRDPFRAFGAFCGRWLEYLGLEYLDPKCAHGRI
jgi:hypothetical protein